MTDVEATDTSNPNLNYGLVVDCGSSGSRVFVYCWPRHNGNPHELLDIQQMRDQHRKPVVMKIKPGKICSTVLLIKQNVGKGDTNYLVPYEMILIGCKYILKDIMKHKTVNYRLNQYHARLLA